MRGHAIINGVDKYIKCAYIGVNGKAQYVLKPPGVIKYGTLSDESKREEPGAGSIGDYALFVGGYSYDENYDDYDISSAIAYNSNLTKSSIGNISLGRNGMASANTPSYVLFSGGCTSPLCTRENVDAYNKSLTRSTASNLYSAVYNHAGVSIGNYAIFAGGKCENQHIDGYRVSYVTAYSNTLTRTQCSSLSVARDMLGAAATGNYAIFSSGDTVREDDDYYYDIYNDNLSKFKSEKGTLRLAESCGVSFNNYALFIGAYDWPNKVFGYDSSLTSISIQDTTYKHIAAKAVALNNYLIIFGSDDSNGGKLNSMVEYYDSNLTLRGTMNGTMSWSGSFQNDSVATTGKYAILYFGSLAGSKIQDVFYTN